MAQGQFEEINEILSTINNGKTTLDNILKDLGYEQEKERETRSGTRRTNHQESEANTISEDPSHISEVHGGGELRRQIRLKQRVSDIEEDFSGRERAIARGYYERMVSGGSFQFVEALQDSMLSLKRLYQAKTSKLLLDQLSSSRNYDRTKEAETRHKARLDKKSKMVSSRSDVTDRGRTAKAGRQKE